LGWIFTGIPRKEVPEKGFLSLNQYLLNCMSVFQCFKRHNFTKKGFSNFLIIGKTTFSDLILRNGRTILPENAWADGSSRLGQLPGEGGRRPQDQPYCKVFTILEITGLIVKQFTEVSKKPFLLQGGS